jgi:AcrR family transcriptional regulator
MATNPSDKKRLPGARTAEHAERQRARILKAAREAFIESGFHEASMSTVAKRAGVSQGLAYCYFESKYAIFEELVRREVHGFWEKARTIRTKQDFVANAIECLRSLYLPSGVPGDAALYLELRVEAARNKQIADCIRALDDTGLDIDRRVLRSIYEGEKRAVSDEQIENKMMLVDTLVDGVVTQLARGRVIDLDRYFEVIRKSLESIIEA